MDACLMHILAGGIYVTKASKTLSVTTKAPVETDFRHS